MNQSTHNATINDHSNSHRSMIIIVVLIGSTARTNTQIQYSILNAQYSMFKIQYVMPNTYMSLLYMLWLVCVVLKYLRFHQ